MMTKLSELVEHGFDHWKLDGVLGSTLCKIQSTIKEFT